MRKWLLSILNVIHRILGMIRDLFIHPSIERFEPIRGCPGIVLVINGNNFSSKLEENSVTVGGAQAHVVEASPDRLKIITSYATKSGPLEVEVGDRKGVGPVDFQALRWPTESRGEDGPPIFYTGFGRNRDDCDMPSTGDLRTLIVLCHPADRIPPDPIALRDEVQEKFARTRTYYQQVSYGRLDFLPTITSDWCRLDSNLDDLSGAAIPPQAADYAARQALGETSTREEREAYLADFTLIISLLYTNDERSFHPFPLEESELLQYTNPAADINIDLHNESSLWTTLLLDETYSWEVWAHEIGHCLVSMPAEEIVPHEGGEPVGPWRWAAILGEDLYPSFGTSTDASAAIFDLMGHHWLAAMFSAYYMEQLGYYDSANIRFLRRSEDAEFSEEFDVVAHGVSENSDSERCHLVKIQVAPGLLYYVEVRQRPDPSDPESQVFDSEIRLPHGSTRSGGVVVTKVFVGTVNMNQRMRFITALKPPLEEPPQPFHPVLIPGDEIIDPARNLRISVMEDVSERPLTSRVLVEWSPVEVEELPSGDINLRITPWNRHYATPDIWVNRLDNDVVDGGTYIRRYDVFEHPELGLDPDGSMDLPRVDTRNEVLGRIHCDGPRDAVVNDVNVTFYAVTPPGVGDNGNWAPLGTLTEHSIEAGNFTEKVWPNWVPEIGEHTCLKLYATADLPSGEKLETSAQENVFEFLEAESESIPHPVVLSLAIRNPREERISALISVRNVPEGFLAHFPHRWVWLDPLQERRMALIMVPTRDYGHYRQMDFSYAKIKVNGWVKHYYREEVEPGLIPPPCLLPMGGILARVTPKQRAKLHLWENQQQSQPDVVAVKGEIDPPMEGELVTVDIEDPAGRHYVSQLTTKSGGRFSATFDLKKSPSLQTEPKSGEEKPLPGVYVAKVLIVNSPHAAKAESNIVYLTK